MGIEIEYTKGRDRDDDDVSWWIFKFFQGKQEKIKWKLMIRIYAKLLFLFNVKRQKSYRPKLDSKKKEFFFFLFQHSFFFLCVWLLKIPFTESGWKFSLFLSKNKAKQKQLQAFLLPWKLHNVHICQSQHKSLAAVEPLSLILSCSSTYIPTADRLRYREEEKETSLLFFFFIMLKNRRTNSLPLFFRV